MATISVIVTAGVPGGAFSITGTGFGGTTGVVYCYPSTTSGFAFAAVTTWNNTAITGTLPVALRPGDEAYIVVKRNDSAKGVRSETFTVATPETTAAAEIPTYAEVSTTPGATDTVGDPVAAPTVGGDTASPEPTSEPLSYSEPTGYVSAPLNAGEYEVTFITDRNAPAADYTTKFVIAGSVRLRGGLLSRLQAAQGLTRPGPQLNLD